MRVLITGGTGWIGRALVPALSHSGHLARVLTRMESPPEEWDTSVDWVHWPGAPSSDIPDSALDGVDAIINMAGASIGGGRWTKQRKDELYRSRIETTNSLVDAIERRADKPSLLISASAVGYYGALGDEAIAEAAQPGDDFLATVCAHWEEAAKHVIPLGVRLVILRIGVVLGKGGGALPKMAMPFKMFAGGALGSGQQVMSWVHRDDVIGVIQMALEREDVSGPINLAAPKPATNREFSKVLGRVLHRPSFWPVPGFVLRLLLGEMSNLALTGQRVMPKRLQELGYQFKHTELEQALRASL